jgi:hypothetical protein
MARIIYSRGFPYGAPLAMIRGGATKDADVKAYLKSHGMSWDGGIYAYTQYLDRRELGAILKSLRDDYGCEVMPKDTMDLNYRIDLDDPNFGRGE